MSDIFAIDLAAQAVAEARDVVEFTMADDRLLEIVAIFLHNNTDFGDAKERVYAVQIIRGFTTSGLGGAAAPTARPLKRNGVATLGATIDTIWNTTLATVGTTHTLLTDGWNIRIPYVWHPVSDDEYPDATQADTTLLIRLPDTPAESFTARGCVWVREH